MYVLTHLSLNKLSHTVNWKSPLLFRYVRLYYIDGPKEKWLNYLQTVETLIRCHIFGNCSWSALFARYLFRGLHLQWANTKEKAL